MRRAREWIVKGAGLLIGFGLSMLLLFFFSVGFGGLWLPMATGILCAFLFGMLPRLNDSGARWYLGAFQTNGMAWMYIVSAGLFAYGPVGRMQKLAIGIWAVAIVIPFVACLYLFAKNKTQKRPAIGWLFTIVLMSILIGYASSSNAGANPMVEWFASHFKLSNADAELSVIAFRKAIHFSFYGFLGFAALQAAWGSGAGRTSPTFAVGFTLTIATFDELRQHTAIGRTGSGWDVLLDLIGAAIFITLATRQLNKKGPNPKVSNPISSTMRP